MAAVWAHDGEREAIEVVRAAVATHGDIDLEWTPAAASAAPPAATEGTIAVDVPVLVDGAVVGTLDLRRSVPSEGALLREQLHDEMVFPALLAVSLAALAVALGGAVIGRPLQRAVAQAERIGGGDLSHRLVAKREDEIGALENAVPRSTASSNATASARRKREPISESRFSPRRVFGLTCSGAQKVPLQPTSAVSAGIGQVEAEQ